MVLVLTTCICKINCINVYLVDTLLSNCNLMCPIRMEPLLNLNVIIDWLDWVIGVGGDDIVWVGVTPCLLPLVSCQRLCGVGIISQLVFGS
jgi:hypothetical protein